MRRARRVGTMQASAQHKIVDNGGEQAISAGNIKIHAK